MSDLHDDVVTITQDGAELATSVAASAMAIAAAAADPALADVATLAPELPAAENPLPKQAVLNEDGSVTLPLYVPVTLRWKAASSDTVNSDPPIEQLTMRRLTGKDMRVIMSAGVGDQFLIKLTGACVAGMPEIKAGRWPLIFDRMDAADSQAATIVANYFLNNGPKTPGR